MIAILILLVVLAGGGFGGWMLYQSYMTAEDEVEDPGPVGPPVAIKLPSTLTVPLIRRGEIRQTVSIEVTLDVAHSEYQTDVRAKLPWLTDAFITTLYGALDDGSVIDGTIVNVLMVKDKLMAAATRVLGPEILNGVLVQAVVQRPR